MKCVQVETQQFMLLKDNELMGSIGEHVLPVTCDSGADITIVPEECVPQKDFTGDTCEVASFNRKISSGKICNIVVTVGGRQFLRKAVAQPGADLGWTVCLRQGKGRQEFRDSSHGREVRLSRDHETIPATNTGGWQSKDITNGE